MIHREDAEQRALIQWADIVPMPAGLALYKGSKVGDYLFAIPNGGARNPVEGARLVGLGVRAGVSDLFFSFPAPSVPAYHGLYIEMKAPQPHASKLTNKQNTFLMRMHDAGYHGVVCLGWEPARNAILKYLMCDL